MADDEDDLRSGAPRSRQSTVSTRRIYSGKVLTLDVDRVRFPNGTEGDLELIRHSGAAAVVPFVDDPRRDDPRILLIRQFRYAADRFLLEVPAGRLDSEESPVHCARRELREEAGCTAELIRSIGGFYTTPGFIDEYIHAFMATGLVRGDSSPESDEFMEVESHSLRDALRMIERGEIVDGKTIVSLFLAERIRRQ